MLPLNGTKTHPLSEHALRMLQEIASENLPRSLVNPGVVNRLERERLVQTVMGRSPFGTHKGKQIQFLKITAAGLGRLSKEMTP